MPHLQASIFTIRKVAMTKKAENKDYLMVLRIEKTTRLYIQQVFEFT